MKYNTYLFDLDGTLIDSMPVFVSLMAKILDDNGIDYDADTVKAITPLGYGGIAKYFSEKLGLKIEVGELMGLVQKHIYSEYAQNIPAKPNVVKVLNELKARGADLNILTASPHIVLDVCLKRLGIYDLFTNIWSCDDFKTTKADPNIYVSAAEKIGQRVEDILFLDDNYHSNKTAKTAGMKTCGVYDETSADFADDIKSVTDHYICDFEELLSL